MHIKRFLRVVLLALLAGVILVHVFSAPPDPEYSCVEIQDPFEYAKNRQLAPDFLESYQPEAIITRLEFVSLLGQALCVKMPFCGLSSDVSEDIPGAKYVDWAMRNHLVGDSNGINQQQEVPFFPDDGLTREQMAVILGRLIATKCLDLDIKEPEIKASFSDADEISSYARDYLEMLATYGLIQPDNNGRIHPKEQITQMEALTTVTQLLLNAKSTRPPSNNGAHLRVRFDAQDEQDNRIILAAVPFQSENSNYGRAWRCIKDTEGYRELALGINQLIYTDALSNELTSAPLDMAALDDDFFNEHNLIAVNMQSFMDPQFDASIQRQIIGKNTLWMRVKTHTGKGMTADAIGYLFLITVPKSVTQMVWAWWLP